MQATIMPNGNLRIDADEFEREDLGEYPNIVSNEVMYTAFESLIANSEYDWILPEYIGALTDAPILGIYGDSVPGNPETDGGRLAGHWDEQTWIDPVLESWWYPNYMIRSPQEDLSEYGFCIFEKG